MKSNLGYLCLLEVIEGKILGLERQQFMEEALNELKPNEVKVIRHYFDLDSRKPTYSEIGGKLGITEEAVRILLIRGLSKLKRVVKQKLTKISISVPSEVVDKEETNPLFFRLEEFNFSVR